MITYMGLMDLLNHRGMKKTDLLKILSSKTLAKLSKDEYVSGEVLEKICIFLKCQPGDIMTVLETDRNETEENIMLHEVDYKTPNWQSTTQIGTLTNEFTSWRDVTWIDE
ncbi:MAG: helix-turn-helix domain-containing protein [Lachnospiraceae bacterium]|nr:helix-turn-helix domain-containing protein [Lachnospiraceae bacterium]